MQTAPKWPQNLSLADYGQDFQQEVSRKVEAFERFVNLNAITLGLLQVLALEMSQQGKGTVSSLVSHLAQAWIPQWTDCTPLPSASATPQFSQK